jgi:hypothetical protein
MHRPSHVLCQAVTAGASDASAGPGSDRSSSVMQQMLQKEPPWWSALCSPSNGAWLQLFLRNSEFRGWYDGYAAQQANSALGSL